MRGYGGDVTEQQIFEKVKTAHAAAQIKHGSWAGLSKEQQCEAIEEEISEWIGAHDADIVDGDHVEISEAIDVIVVMIRRIMFLTGEDQ